MPFFRSGIKKGGGGNPDLEYTVCYMVNGETIPFKGSLRDALDNSKKYNKPFTIGTNVGDCSNLFQGYNTSNRFLCNFPITIPNSVENCRGMFQAASFNQPLTIPNSVKDCSYMFHNSAFNQSLIIPDSVTNCMRMFEDSSIRDQTVIIGNNVEDCSYMFSKSYPSTGLVIPKNVINCFGMFGNSHYLKDSTIYINGNPNTERMFTWVHNNFVNNKNRNMVVYAGSSINANKLVYAYNTWYTFTPLQDGNGYYNSYLNFYVYNNYVGT